MGGAARPRGFAAPLSRLCNENTLFEQMPQIKESNVPTLVEHLKTQLEDQGEYVVLANLDTGWFAINPNTWEKRLARCKTLGREGPNLIVYRTLSGEERDHHVVPFRVIEPMLSGETLKLQKNGSYRWNLTLRNDRLHVSHRRGYASVEDGLAAILLVEHPATDSPAVVIRERVSLRTNAYEGIVEGIARESVVLSRSRSSRLRHEALRLSEGVCECCGVDFSHVLHGKGLRALQVHHKKQLALRETPEATSLQDLAVVCANCHAIIHTDPKNAIPVEVMKEEWNRQI
jgi:uncharacterized protein YegP (UPF0339 family)